jgi:hypothetical protein
VVRRVHGRSQLAMGHTRACCVARGAGGAPNSPWWVVGDRSWSEVAWWRVARWGHTSTRLKGAGAGQIGPPPSRVVLGPARGVAMSGGGAHALWWHRGPAPTPRRSCRGRESAVASPWPLVRSVESCQACSRMTIVTSVAAGWRGVGCSTRRAPYGDPTQAAAIPHVSRTTHGR